MSYNNVDILTGTRCRDSSHNTGQHFAFSGVGCMGAEKPETQTSESSVSARTLGASVVGLLTLPTKKTTHHLQRPGLQIRATFQVIIFSEFASPRVVLMQF